MAAKFIELEQAAAMLGVSNDKLNDMRLKGDIFGVRDGSSWKFKQEELERVAEDQGITLTTPSQEDDADDLLDLGDASDSGSSDLDLDFASDGDASPTAIGKAEDFGDLLGGEDSNLELSASTSSDELGLQDPGGSDVALVAGGSGSELDLIADDSRDVLGGSDDDLGFEGSDLGFEGSDLSIQDAGGTDSGLALGEDDEDDLTIGDDEEIALDEDDDELVLDGGDITGGSGDTGINLTSPSDSGLNLEEEPLDLAGSSVSSLELPEDDEIIDLDDLDAVPDDANQLQADEDFQLEPSAFAEEDEEDSGSQVIALEDSEAFGAQAAEGALDEVEPVLGAEQPDELDGALDAYETAPVTQPTMAAAYGPSVPEMSYSIWNVISLLLITMLLSVTGMLMTDVVRNIWSWDSTFSASTPIMDMMVNMLGLNP